MSSKGVISVSKDREMEDMEDVTGLLSHAPPHFLQQQPQSPQHCVTRAKGPPTGSDASWCCCNHHPVGIGLCSGHGDFQKKMKLTPWPWRIGHYNWISNISPVVAKTRPASHDGQEKTTFQFQLQSGPSPAQKKILTLNFSSHSVSGSP